jgi:hypothetical protein
MKKRAMTIIFRHAAFFSFLSGETIFAQGYVGHTMKLWFESNQSSQERARSARAQKKNVAHFFLQCCNIKTSCDDWGNSIYRGNITFS